MNCTRQHLFAHLFEDDSRMINDKSISGNMAQNLKYAIVHDIDLKQQKRPSAATYLCT
jgi:hypothetical protein